MSDRLDTFRYQDGQNDTITFLHTAADAFGSEHCGLPEGMIVDLFRRVTALPAQNWTAIQHGALPIPLYSPGEDALPLALRYVTVGWDEAFCFRSSQALSDIPIESSDTLSGQGEPTLHGITQAPV